MRDLFNKLLLEALQEGKQVGKLYHFTAYSRMIQIVESDLVLKGDQSQSGEWISFTRNSKFLTTSVTTDQVRITVDGTKMSSKYKIEPYSDYTNSFGRRHNSDESEERIDASRYGGEVNIKPYILSIDMRWYRGDLEDRREYRTELANLMSEKGIKYNIVEKFI